MQWINHFYNRYPSLLSACWSSVLHPCFTWTTTSLEQYFSIIKSLNRLHSSQHWTLHLSHMQSWLSTLQKMSYLTRNYHVQFVKLSKSALVWENMRFHQKIHPKIGHLDTFLNNSAQSRQVQGDAIQENDKKILNFKAPMWRLFHCRRKGKVSRTEHDEKRNEVRKKILWIFLKKAHTILNIYSVI